MNSAEVASVVETEIASRYRSLDDTVRGDWTRAIWKCGDIEKAKNIIRELVDDPDASLNIKQFYARLKARTKLPVSRRTDGPIAYDPFVMCLEPPEDCPKWKGMDWFVMGGPAESNAASFRRSDQTNKQAVGDYAGEIAKQYQQVYGGQWCGLTRVVDNAPYEGEMTFKQRFSEAERRVLSGPDTSGKRWLLRKRKKPELLLPDVKPVPSVEPPKRIATKDMIERMRSIEPNPKASPMEDAEEFFNRESAELAATEPERDFVTDEWDF